MPPKFYQSEVLRKFRSDLSEAAIRADLEAEGQREGGTGYGGKQ